jgi:rhamnose utilization protein RhaD (predicted bifunctional aldolase and dehydrogenase)
MTEVHELVEICRYAGASALLAQGGGGNGSVKSPDGSRMWVKASGTRMADVTESGGFVETDRPRLLQIVRDDGTTLAESDALLRSQTAVIGGSGRASMEAGFHALLGRVVLHTHPVYVNAFTCMIGGRGHLETLWGRELAWVPYCAPGHQLALAVDRACAEFDRRHGTPPRVIALENHGLIVSADSAEEAITLTTEVDATGLAWFGAIPSDACEILAPAPSVQRWAAALLATLETRHSVRRFAVRAATRRVLADAAGSDALLTSGALVPDDVVYCGAPVWRVPASRDASDWADEWLARCGGGAARAVIALDGAGVVLVSRTVRDLDAIEETALAHVLVAQLVARRGQLRTLSGFDIEHLLGMEAEHYRQAVAAAAASPAAL